MMAEWPPNSVDALKRMVAQRMSAGEIAKALSRDFGRTFSRNTIISKCYRLGLKLQGNAGAPGKPRPKAAQANNGRGLSQFLMREPVKKAGAPPPPPHPAPVAPGRRGVSIMQLNNKRCRWPIGDPRSPGFCFCGAKPDHSLRADEPYCAEHAALAYNPGAVRR